MTDLPFIKKYNYKLTQKINFNNDANANFRNNNRCQISSHENIGKFVITKCKQTCHLQWSTHYYYQHYSALCHVLSESSGLTPSTATGWHLCFRGTCRFHLQGRIKLVLLFCHLYSVAKPGFWHPGQAITTAAQKPQSITEFTFIWLSDLKFAEFIKSIFCL
jgi:hypothetical protein